MNVHHFRVEDNYCKCMDWSKYIFCSCLSTRFVFIAMEALDQLLMSCHAHSLNLFVESYLKMVQKLLECSEPDLQITATSSVSVFPSSVSVLQPVLLQPGSLLPS